MTKGLILLTGGTGHVGFATLVYALEQGYRVRAAVRRESAVADIKQPKSIQPYLPQLSFIIVPDITRDAAFDEAVKGVDFVLHIASPLPKASDDYEQSHIIPAVKGTTSILYSALKQNSIKKVVITASVASCRPHDGKTDTFNANTVVPDIFGPFSDPGTAYRASKIRAHNSVLKFIKEEQPAFDIINIMPAFVIGPNELMETADAAASGSNNTVFDLVLGQTNPVPTPLIVVHVDDVKFLHVASLGANITGHQNFGASWPQRFDWNDIFEIVKKRFPEEVKNGILPLGGSKAKIVYTFDVSRTEKVFDFKFKDLDRQVTDLVRWYLTLPGIQT